MKKRILSLCLALVMVLGLTPVVFADSFGSGYGSWSLSGTTLTITGAMPDYTSVDRYPYYNDVKDLASFKVTATGCTHIGSYAFDGLKNLTEVTLAGGGNSGSGSLETIGEYAFQGCTGLTSIKTPVNLKTIGVGAFKGCTGLSSIQFTKPDNQSLTQEIQDNAFEGCTSLTTITLPGNSLTTLGNGAFANCSNLSQVNYNGDLLTNVGSGVFAGCSSNLNIDDILDVLEANGVSVNLLGNLPEVTSNHAISLSDQIGLIFIVFVPNPDEINKDNFVVQFSIAGDDTQQAVSLSQAVTTKDPNKFYFTCNLNALQLADEVTATIYIDGVAQTESFATGKSTVCAVIEDYKDRATETNDGTLMDLVKSLQAYGNSLWEIQDTINDGNSNHAKISAPADWTINLNDVKTAIYNDGKVLSFTGNPTSLGINVNLTEKSCLKVRVGSETQKATDIGPLDLDYMFGFDFDDGTHVDASVLSYVYAVLNNSNSDYKHNAVASLYYYNQCAKDYVAAHPQSSN